MLKRRLLLVNNSLFVMLISTIYSKVYLVRFNLHGIHDKNNVGKVISQFSLNDPLSSSSLKEVGETSRISRPLNSNYKFDT
ncbi:BnaA05g19930D [Brassica napus]|uniref:BnaA05g19930D protein n=1 Tax=Brassica napus TaxID=3708 RepID=A0A078FZ15_BRANA|nr:BnaA05g19930D [Brassica napus]